MSDSYTSLGTTCVVEREERNVSLQNIVRIAAGLGVDPETLVKGIGG